MCKECNEGRKILAVIGAVAMEEYSKLTIDKQLHSVFLMVGEAFRGFYASVRILDGGTAVDMGTLNIEFGATDDHEDMQIVVSARVQDLSKLVPDDISELDTEPK